MTKRSLGPPPTTRARRNIDLTCGRIMGVEVVYDTEVEGGRSPGLLTEMLFHGESNSTHLIAAEAYSRDKWHLYDESIVALTTPAAADALAWFPRRQTWRSTAQQSADPAFPTRQPGC